MALLGASQQDLVVMEAKFNADKPQDLVVWPENVLAMRIFMVCATQWRRNQMDGSHESLRWDAISIALNRNCEARKLKDTAIDDLFSQIVLMERVALEEFANIRQEQKSE
ncbi:MAG: DUF1799 domain-containing protein [Pseudomonadota bacterium]|nr:DUF1799 domain-containing protein [Pseudomonadota bacterium]